MEVANILENKNQGFIYGLMGNINLTTNYNNYSIITGYRFSGTVKDYLNSNKDISSLKMVMLKEDILNKHASELSIGDLKKISLAKALIENKEYLIFDYFEKEMNAHEKEHFKRLWKRLTNDYHKTIVIFTNDITSFWDIAQELIIVDKYKVINTIPKDKYYDFMDDISKPEIIKFIDLLKAKNIAIDYYQDPKDLLKAIYRLKENTL